MNFDRVIVSLIGAPLLTAALVWCSTHAVDYFVHNESPSEGVRWALIVMASVMSGASTWRSV